jgi:hypothetical protein
MSVDFNDAAPQQAHGEREQLPARPRYVPTAVAHQAVEGKEAEAVRALGIRWHGRDHITCPYPGHQDKDPSWRLMDNGNAVCTCTPSHSVFDVAMHLEGLDFESANIRVMEAIGRGDLIVDPNAEKPKPEGLTLEAYAAAKRLPIDSLKGFGLRQGTKKGAPAVRVPYFRADAREPVIKHRWRSRAQRTNNSIGHSRPLYFSMANGTSRISDASVTSCS